MVYLEGNYDIWKNYNFMINPSLMCLTRTAQGINHALTIQLKHIQTNKAQRKQISLNISEHECSTVPASEKSQMCVDKRILSRYIFDESKMYQHFSSTTIKPVN